MTTRHFVATALCCLAGLACLSGPASAEPAPAAAGNQMDASIGERVLEQAAGSAAVNVVAGIGNAQANLGALSPTGTASVASSQRGGAIAAAADARSHVGAGAFANARGILATNLAAGNGNVQVNAAAIGPAASVTIEAASDGLLASASANGSRTGSMSQASGLREAVVHPDAYRNASGLVQLNQTAGSGNASSNVFVLRPPAGTFFQ